jgi:threonine dehydratase
MSDVLPHFEDVVAAAGRLKGHAHRTPVMTSQTVDERAGASVFFKCENLQRMGAFKYRGAYNALVQLPVESRRRGVLAYSSGNHAQAVALAGRDLGIPAVIVMPQDAPAVKIEATRGYGAEVVLYDRHTQDREAFSAALAKERGLPVIPPFDHPHIVAGQGTAALELFEEVGPLDDLFVPCGGAGLLSGCGLAASGLSPQCRVIGIEPAAGDDATRSFRTKTLQSCHNPDTIADGARTHALGRITFPLVMANVHDMDTVDDAALLEVMFFLWERMKLVVEPTGALGAAGVFKSPERVRGRRVGVILSGGNADVRALAALR